MSKVCSASSTSDQLLNGPLGRSGSAGASGRGASDTGAASAAFTVGFSCGFGASCAGAGSLGSALTATPLCSLISIESSLSYISCGTSPEDEIPLHILMTAASSCIFLFAAFLIFFEVSQRISMHSSILESFNRAALSLRPCSSSFEQTISSPQFSTVFATIRFLKWSVSSVQRLSISQDSLCSFDIRLRAEVRSRFAIYSENEKR